jgi:hypothetical protein
LYKTVSFFFAGGVGADSADRADSGDSGDTTIIGQQADNTREHYDHRDFGRLMSIYYPSFLVAIMPIAKSEKRVEIHSSSVRLLARGNDPVCGHFVDVMSKDIRSYLAFTIPLCFRTTNIFPI